jgi:hypothetical protein
MQAENFWSRNGQGLLLCLHYFEIRVKIVNEINLICWQCLLGMQQKVGIIEMKCNQMPVDFSAKICRVKNLFEESSHCAATNDHPKKHSIHVNYNQMRVTIRLNLLLLFGMVSCIIFAHGVMELERRQDGKIICNRMT